MGDDVVISRKLLTVVQVLTEKDGLRGLAVHLTDVHSHFLRCTTPWVVTNPSSHVGVNDSLLNRQVERECLGGEQVHKA